MAVTPLQPAATANADASIALIDAFDLPEELGTRLPLIPRIEKGFGVVPVLDDGAVLLRPGDVAVYDEEWLKYNEVTPGLYCYEHQRPVSLSPHFDSWRIVTREVVYMRRSPRSPGCWDKIALRSKVIGGIRRYSVPDGPMYEVALYNHLLGPIVGIYAPALIHGDH